jgi:hypothetical protein
VVGKLEFVRIFYANNIRMVRSRWTFAGGEIRENHAEFGKKHRKKGTTLMHVRI